MAVSFGPGTNLEPLQRALLLQLKANVNDKLDELNEFWKPKDEELAAALGYEYVDSTCEHIAVFSDGHRPSFIDAPIENYPNISVMAYHAEPSPEQFDQADSYSNTAFVELIVKSQTFEDDDLKVREDAETVVNRRVQRTADAVQRSVSLDPTLGGTIFTLQNPPTVDITDVFIRREDVKKGGDKWAWQLARLEWKATTYSNF